jgi:hypothetical protein
VVTGGPISCGSACSAEGGRGSQITLTASADANNAFDGWGGACSGDSPRCTVTLDADKRVTAEFRPIRDRVVVSKNGNGSVASSSPGVDCGSKCAGEFVRGSTISLAAAPGPDSFFGGWTGACSGSNPTCSLPVNGTATVTANFVKATLKLRRAAFQVSWKLSHAEGTLVLAGAVNGPAELKLTLSGRLLDKLPQSDVAASAPGNFRRVLPLPAGMLPGSYTLDVSGRIGGVAVARRKVIILRAPTSGVVSEASASSTATGQAVESLSANSTEMWARFTFAAQPKPACFLKRKGGKKVRTCRSPQLTLTWTKPDGTLAVAPQALRPGANVAAGVSATPPIDAGTWTVTLKVGRTAVCELKFVVNR